MEKTRNPNNIVNIIKETNLHFDSLTMYGGRGKIVVVCDPAQPNEKQNRRGDYFITLPKEIVAILPGSTLLAGGFLKELGQGNTQETIAQLESDYKYDEDKGPALDYKEDNFNLKVYNGSVTERALYLSELATRGFDDSETRADYQETAKQVAESILKDESTYNLRIVEDVIASGETIAGVLALLKRKDDIEDEYMVRIDVISATTQGLLVLRKFAHDNNIKLDIRVGYLAYGLSAGQSIEDSKAKKHANYVTYSSDYLNQLDDTTKRKLEDLKNDDGNIYVIGDMGDAFQSLPVSYNKKCPWNQYRYGDNHGDRDEDGEKKKIIESQQDISTYYFANGGYFMQALVRYFRLNVGEQHMISAKRVWTNQNIMIDNQPQDGTDDSYGVLIDLLEREKGS